MFSQACVKNSVWGYIPACTGADTPWADTPWADTPWVDTSSRQTPPWADTPPGQTPPGQTPPAQTHPWPNTLRTDTPLSRHLPPTATAADDTHNTGMHSCVI